MHNNTTIEIWHDDLVRSSVWWPYSEDATPIDYEYLRPVKRYDTFDYLSMLIRLLPYGYIWRFPYGEPGDY